MENYRCSSGVSSATFCTFFGSPIIKDPLSCIKQFVTTESPLKMMKNAFNFMLKVLLVLEIFKFLPCRFDKEAEVNF